MKKIAVLFAGLVAALSVAPGLSLASDATAPVKEIIDDTKKNWASDVSDWIDIFQESMLDRLYSKDFGDKYKAAAKNPAADEDGISPFDYDVIVNGQDACPLQDLSIENGQPANGTTEVTVKFKAAKKLRKSQKLVVKVSSGTATKQFTVRVGKTAKGALVAAKK